MPAEKQTGIALLRGINVGGRHLLPMKSLVSLMESVGFENIRTYIQSGNVVFDHSGTVSEESIESVRGLVEEHHGFSPEILVLTLEQFRRAIQGNPYPEAVDDPKSLHLSFLSEEASRADLEGMEALKSPTEHFQLTGRVFYLHAPDGIGRSKLAAKVEPLLGVPATGRNWRTVMKLADLAGLGG